MPFPLTALLLDDMTGTTGTAVTNRAGNACKWGATRINAATAPALQSISNQLGTVTAGSNAYFGAGAVATALFGPDTEIWFDVPVLPGASQYIAVWVRLNTVGGTTFNGYAVLYTHTAGSWQLRKYTAGVSANLGSAGTQVMAAGDGMGLQVLGGTLSCWWRTGAAGAWVQKASVVDTTFPAAGQIGIEFGDTVARVDNLRGGTTPLPRIWRPHGMSQAVHRAAVR